MTQFFGYSIPVPPWFAITSFAVVWVALSLLIARLFQIHVRRWAEKTESRFGILLVEALHGPLLILLLLIGGQVALGAMELTRKVERFASVGISLTTAFVLIYAKEGG